MSYFRRTDKSKHKHKDLHKIERKLDIEEQINDEQESEIVLLDSRIDNIESKLLSLDHGVDVEDLKNRIIYLEQIIQSLVNR